MSEPIMKLFETHGMLCSIYGPQHDKTLKAYAAIEREVAALRERAERAEAVLREAPHEPHCAGQLDVRVWPKETRIICCTCFKNRYQEVACQTNPA